MRATGNGVLLAEYRTVRAIRLNKRGSERLGHWWCTKQTKGKGYTFA